MAATYTPIASTTLGTATSTVTFSSIPQTYTDLVLIFQAKMATSSQPSNLQFNSDTGTNYSYTRIYGNGSSAISDRGSGGTNIDAAFVYNTDFTIVSLQIQNYTNSTTYKSTLSRWNNSTFTGATVGLWRNTNAITSLSLNGNSFNYIAGSTFTLYGIKAGNA